MWAPKWSGLHQTVDQQPLRKTTETAPGLWFAIEDSTENISANDNDGNICTSLPVAGQVQADGPWPLYRSSLPQTNIQARRTA